MDWSAVSDLRQGAWGSLPGSHTLGYRIFVAANKKSISVSVRAFRNQMRQGTTL